MPSRRRWAGKRNESASDYRLGGRDDKALTTLQQASNVKPSRRRFLRAAAGGFLAVLLAGCTGERADESETTGDATAPTRTPTPTALPQKRHELPDGPKSPPEPPDAWTEKTAGEYAIKYEERHVYNRLHTAEASDVNVGCNVTESEAIDGGYRVVLLCGGAVYSEEKTTHGDYIGKPVTYLVGDGTAIRSDAATRAAD